MSGSQHSLPYWRLSGFYFVWAVVIGALLPYWSLYLKHLGYDERAIGLLSATLAATQVVAPFLWGYLADRCGRRASLIRAGLWLALFCFGGVYFEGGGAWLALVLFGFGSFWNAMAPQLEALTLGHLRHQPDRYSLIRLWGSIGFIASVLLLGGLLDHTGPAILPAYILVGLGLTLLASYSVNDPATDVPPAQRLPLMTVLKRPPVLTFFVTGLLMHASHGPYNTFYSLYLREHDYSGLSIGLLWSLGTAAEVGIFLLMHRCLARFELRRLLLFSLLAAAMRWSLIGAFADQLAVLIFAQCLHAATFGCFHAAAIESIRRHFQPSLAGQGQALYYCVCVGIGTSVGALYSGLLWPLAGPVGTFVAASLLALAGAWLFRPQHRSARADAGCGEVPDLH
ncbi:MFS metabolite transporter [Marinobacterium nitratireducens]|uniref:MFS metabolite transporter n=1 Tax=Marinobacterium nitratireducens TaxID=518897 RepID=A0A917ZN06_9GAMM|nr:MFS transporter [Marinobacterium nitratireducens]GGO85544.1 MFS metabolite transporter [Marinobacterium nitratireducens]